MWINRVLLLVPLLLSCFLVPSFFAEPVSKDNNFTDEQGRQLGPSGACCTRNDGCLPDVTFRECKSSGRGSRFRRNKSCSEIRCRPAKGACCLADRCIRCANINQCNRRGGTFEEGKSCADPDVCSDGPVSSICGDNDGTADANIEDYPFQASLQQVQDDGTWKHICGAVIISETRALTAATCVFNTAATNFRLVAGTDDLTDTAGGNSQTRAITSKNEHPSFNNGACTLCDNIATVSFSALEFAEDVSAASLASPSSGNFAGATATVTGWGETAEIEQIINDQLQQRDETVVTTTACRNASSASSDVSDTAHICTFGNLAPSCVGDIGGPWTVGSTVVGIYSWPADLFVDYEDAPNYPRVATRISTYRSWIG